MQLLIKIYECLPDDVIKRLTNYYSNYIKKHATDSGLDLMIPNDIVCPKNTRSIPINLGICCQPEISNDPHGYYLFARSCIVKTPLRMSNSVGIIDEPYRGPITAYVDNISDEDYTINVHDGTIVKLFQICDSNLQPFSFKLVDQLDITTRGAGGFGSTN